MLKMWVIAPTYLDNRMLQDMWVYGLRLLDIISGSGQMTTEEQRYYLGYPMYQKLIQLALPKIFLGQYLGQVAEELKLRRGIEIDVTPIRNLQVTPGKEQDRVKIVVPEGQLEYEKEFLLKRLSKEEPLRASNLRSRALKDKLYAFKNIDIQPGYVGSVECTYIQQYCRLSSDRGYFSYHH